MAHVYAEAKVKIEIIFCWFENIAMHVNIKGNFIFALPKHQSLESTAIPASYPGAMRCSMACAAFAWAAWINLSLGTRQPQS
jgi:hypothetical protein